MTQINIDSIFLEATELENYLAYVTPRGGASLYISEVAADFVVIIRGGNPSMVFAWHLNAYRRGYAETLEIHGNVLIHTSEEMITMKHVTYPNAIRHFVPNAGTLIAVALMLFAYRVWAAPVTETPPPVEPAMATAITAAAPAANVSPGAISYQGTLTDGVGNPISGNIDVTFRLYDAPTGGTNLWTEVRTSANAVPVSNGLFNVLLGSLTPIPSSVWTNADVYLGVQVAGDTEMKPREMVSAVGTAMAVQGEQPYYFHGAFATPTQWMADLIYNQNYANFCQAIGKTYTRADVLQHHYTEPSWAAEWSGRGNGFIYQDWYYIGLRYHETDALVYGNGDPAHPYNVWQYKGGNGCCVASHNWTMEVSVIIWCK